MCAAQQVQVLINYNDNMIALSFPETANVFDLKQAIKERTSVNAEHQNLIGLAEGIAMQELSGDIPLAALGLDPSQPLFLLNEQPNTPPPPPVARRESSPYRQFINPPEERNSPYADMVIPPHYAVPTNPSPALGIGRYIRPNDFKRLLDQCTTDFEVFVTLFESKYGSIHPRFARGQLSEVYDACKLEQKLLLINLQPQDTVVENSDFCSIVLTRPELGSFLDSEEIVFWAGEMTEELKYQFPIVFGTPIQYPFLALIGHINGSFTVLESFNELMPADELINKLRNALATYKKHMLAEKGREAQRKIKEEQNQAFQESLRSDTEKERQKNEAQARQDTNKATKLSLVETARRHALDNFQALAAEPSSSTKVVRVGVRLPDGNRVERKFLPTDSFQMVLNYITGVMAQRLDNASFLDDNSPQIDDNAMDVVPWTIHKYDLIQNFPKKTFDSSQASKTLAELDFGSQTILFMQHKS